VTENVGRTRRPAAAPEAPEVVDPRRRLPAIGILCADPGAQPLNDRFGSAAVAKVMRAVVEDARAGLLEDPQAIPSVESLLGETGRRLADNDRETLSPVINATGVIIHTNLGRAPLAAEAITAMQAAAGYANLELDLEMGRRGARNDHLDALIAEVCGAEAGFAVNNCAGAVLLAMAAIGAGAPIIASRGELVEIGGGFRVPDVVKQSGSSLIEVGTTNRTHMRDYEQAVRDHPDAAVILRTHPSNFRMTGFTSAPALSRLAEFAHAQGLVLIEDLGGGALIDLKPYGIAPEPTVQDSLRAGADLVLFSGDKLLGGPQAGIIAGRRDLIAKLGRHPLARALRLDKLSLAALAATLRLYRPPAKAVRRVPVLRMLTEPASVVAARAQTLLAALAPLPGVEARVEVTQGYAGGGAMPMHALPSSAVAVRRSGLDAEDLARRLRTGASPVLGRIEHDWVLLDLRTVADQEMAAIADAVTMALSAKAGA